MTIYSNYVKSNNRERKYGKIVLYGDETMRELNYGEVKEIWRDEWRNFVCLCGVGEILLGTDDGPYTCEYCGRTYKSEITIYVEEKI